MGIMDQAKKVIDIMRRDDVRNAGATLADAFESVSRSSGAANPTSIETVFNGPNSLARRLFESSHKGARWDNIVMNKGKEGDEWRLSGRRVAAGFVGASSLGRLASGGGIYKDADGNTDIIGIPFI